MDNFTSALELLHAGLTKKPIIIFRPRILRRASQFFQNNFPGKILYAVKANNSPIVIDELYKSGIRTFDVASLTEIQQLQNYKDIELYLMNPIKSRAVISEAYHSYGIRNYSLDSEAELNKILEETNHADDLNLFLRVACDGSGSQIALENKFGVSGQEAIDLLMLVRNVSSRLGITFHVGSQAMVPESYSDALEAISRLIAQSGVLPDMIDVGGGFPSVYPGLTPPPLEKYMNAIVNAFERMNVVETCELLCEPGRALVAEAGAVIVRVDHRKDNYLYINDGSYGCLHDAAHYNFVFPTQLLRPATEVLGSLQPFSFYGPTCDSADFMKGPFLLPDCICEGDHIEIGQLGAYGEVMSTWFNGFGRYDYAVLDDEPIMTLYEKENRSERVCGVLAI